jgi:predicted RNA binding protein YcfA (HicA-like mRNA interferase family)
MPSNIPSLKPRQLIKLLQTAGIEFYRQGKGDHTLYVRKWNKNKKVVPIDTGLHEFSSVYVLRIFRQFGFTDHEIEEALKKK